MGKRGKRLDESVGEELEDELLHMMVGEKKNSFGILQTEFRV